MESLPGAIVTPAPTIMGHHRPPRQVMGQQPPGTTGPRHLGKGIADVALGALRWSSARFGYWDIGGDERPCTVCEISRVRGAGFHAPSLPALLSRVGGFFNTL